ncbi:YoaK family protein [Guyparkeria sp.]|uniref:YoaK family protein n=1 Tax=Guyparkeria sp. TaxID=2035736 RepID=UPI0035629B9C
MPYPHRNQDTPRAKIFVLAFVMAGLAGHVNSAMLLAFGLPVSQMTGTASHLSEGLAWLDAGTALTAVAILAGFVGGATLSGVMIGHRRFPESPRYAWGLGVEMILLLAAATAALSGLVVISLTIAAVACGLQNALVASYRGLLIRTTHITGITTDLGVHLARSIRQRSWSWEISLLFTLMVGYIAGGIGGVVSQALGTAGSLMPAATGAGLMALVARFYQKRHRNH